MEIRLHPFELALRYPFSISRHTYYSLHTLIVELTDGRVSGFGEASANPYYQVTMDSLVSILEEAGKYLKTCNFQSPEKLWTDLEPLCGPNRFALSALDCAAHDYYAKKRGKNLLQLWNVKSYKFPFTSYTLGIDEIDIMKKKMAELPWPIYKIKLGTGKDMEIMNALKKNSTAIFRVDANCAWGRDEAIIMSLELKKIGVEFIEQPLPPENKEAMKTVFEKAMLPLIADESCRIPEDVNNCKEYFHGINIKLAKCGGITPALKMIKIAKKLGLKIMIGCMTESTVGISAAAQLLSFVDYADVDGPLLLAEDVAEGLSYRYGQIKLSGEAGLGFHFKQGKFKSAKIT